MARKPIAEADETADDMHEEARVRLDLRAESRAVSRALKSAADKARAAGIKNPRFYAEAESLGIYVLDGDMFERLEGRNGRVDQASVVGEIGLSNIGAVFDTGAW